MNGACHRCGAEVGVSAVGVRDVCERCRAYLHCCRNCEFYEPGAHNDCREPNAEVVADKEQGNFCDYFRFSSAPRAADSSVGGSGRSRDRDERERSATPTPRRTNDVRSQLDALFRKK
jgi:hypothetical protein